MQVTRRGGVRQLQGRALTLKGAHARPSKVQTGKTPWKKAFKVIVSHSSDPEAKAVELQTPFPKRPPRLSPQERKDLANYKHKPGELPYEALPVLPDTLNPLELFKVALGSQNAKAFAERTLVEDKIVKDNQPEIDRVYEGRNKAYQEVHEAQGKERNDILGQMLLTIAQAAKAASSQSDIEPASGALEASSYVGKALDQAGRAHQRHLEAESLREQADLKFAKDAKMVQVKNEAASIPHMSLEESEDIAESTSQAQSQLISDMEASSQGFHRRKEASGSFFGGLARLINNGGAMVKKIMST